MMVEVLSCDTCRSSWSIVGSEEEVRAVRHLLSNGKTISCITAQCRGAIDVLGPRPIAASTTKELTYRAFFRAIHGFGDGGGAPASEEEFVRLITSQRVVAVDTQSVGQPERVIVRQMLLEDGSRLHFDSSYKGACCYYIERNNKSCVEVVEDELCDVAPNNQSADGSPGQSGEEAGRAPKVAKPGQEQSGGQLCGDAAIDAAGSVPLRTVHGDP